MNSRPHEVYAIREYEIIYFRTFRLNESSEIYVTQTRSFHRRDNISL